MTTVRQAITLLKGAKNIYIAWNGLTTRLDVTSELEMDAYGNYVVGSITDGYERGDFELVIAATPTRA